MAAIQFIDRSTAATLGPPARALARAAMAALSAPSIFNSQPWRWRIGTDSAQLRADRSRQDTTVDPDGRLLTISCGTALHHARTALAASSAVPDVTYLPDPDDPDLLASVRLADWTRPTPEALRLYRAMSMRHTDRRPFADRPAPAIELELLRAAASTYHTQMYMIRRTNLAALTVAPPGQSDVAGTRANRSTMLDRLLAGDRYARYGLLYTDGDDARNWLAAGEALSSVLLTATAHGLATSPLSDMIEEPTARNLLRDLLADAGYPAIVVRIGIPVTPNATGAATARRPATGVVELVAEPITTPASSVS
ncbi:MAG TPA: hypothetical protein VK453_04160 [Micromonosporaceae bacterium]|nr:hypothetical protein [Micromonosporaceae bacterium]